MVVCVFCGYEVPGGRLNKLGIVLCCLISVLMVLFAEYLCISIELYKIFNEYESVGFFEAFWSVPMVLEDSQAMRTIAVNLIMGYLRCNSTKSIQRGWRRPSLLYLKKNIENHLQFKKLSCIISLAVA